MGSQKISSSPSLKTLPSFLTYLVRKKGQSEWSLEVEPGEVIMKWAKKRPMAKLITMRLSTSAEHDEKDQRVIDKVPLHGQNLYPKEVPELKNDIQAWLKEMDRLGGTLMEAFAESLGLKRDFFR